MAGHDLHARTTGSTQALSCLAKDSVILDPKRSKARTAGPIVLIVASAAVIMLSFAHDQGLPAALIIIAWIAAYVRTANRPRG